MLGLIGHPMVALGTLVRNIRKNISLVAEVKEEKWQGLFDQTHITFFDGVRLCEKPSRPRFIHLPIIVRLPPAPIPPPNPVPVPVVSAEEGDPTPKRIFKPIPPTPTLSSANAETLRRTTQLLKAVGGRNFADKLVRPAADAKESTTLITTNLLRPVSIVEPGQLSAYPEVFLQYARAAKCQLATKLAKEAIKAAKQSLPPSPAPHSARPCPRPYLSIRPDLPITSIGCIGLRLVDTPIEQEQVRRPPPSILKGGKGSRGPLPADWGILWADQEEDNQELGTMRRRVSKPIYLGPLVLQPITGSSLVSVGGKMYVPNDEEGGVVARLRYARESLGEWRRESMEL